MANDLVERAMSFIFEADKIALRTNLIALMELHAQPEAGAPRKDILTFGLKYGDSLWFHPDKPPQVRGGAKAEIINVMPEHELRASMYESDLQLLEKDCRRAQKTLNQLVRGMNTDQDLRDSFSDSIAIKLGLAHLPRTREPAFRYEKLEPRVHANILKDLDMIEGYFNARMFLK